MRSMLLGALLGALLASLLTGGGAPAQDAMGIAAVVNDEVISVYDLKARISLAIASSQVDDRPETRRRMAPQVLRGLIDEKVIRQEARRLKVRVTKEDIDRTLAEIEKQNNLPAGGLDRFLASRGVQKPIMIDRIQADIAWAKVIRRKLSSGIRVGEEEIDEALARIKANKGKPQHRVAEIFLPVDNPGQEKQARLMAERLIEQLRSRARFADLARSFSRSPSAAVGGDLGWIQDGQLDEKLDAVLKKMRPGEVSPPIRSLTGYHILRLAARRAAPGLEEGEMTVSLRQLVLPLSDGALPEEVRSQTDLAKTMSEFAGSCQDMDRLVKELNSPMSGSLGRLKLSRLPSDFREAVRDLPIGKASPPLRREGTIVVLMVCEREGQPSDLGERAKIKNMLLKQRLDVAAQRYLRDLRRAAFCEARLTLGPDFDPCK